MDRHRSMNKTLKKLQNESVYFKRKTKLFVLLSVEQIYFQSKKFTFSYCHVRWVQMAKTFSEDLEKAYQNSPSAVLRRNIPNVVSPDAGNPNNVVWKFDLGSMTQRRLVDGKD